MELFNIGTLRLVVWSVFLLFTVEYRYISSTPDNQSFVPTHPTDGGEIKSTITTIHPTVSTSDPPSDHTFTGLPAKTQGPHTTTTTNSTKPPSTNTTLFSTSSKDIHPLPPPTTPGERSNTGASSTNDARTTITPPTTPGERSNTGASSTNDARRNTTWSIIPTLPTNSDSSPTVPISRGTTTVKSTTSPGPVTKQPCPTFSSANNRTAPSRPGVPDCGRSPSGVVGQCLIAIAALAAVLTVFVVSTVVLSTKLSSRKYRLDSGCQHGTEMVCISAVMTGRNDRNGAHANLEAHRTLLTSPEDSDEDGGDNLTLNSFLPDGDRMV